MRLNADGLASRVWSDWGAVCLAAVGSAGLDQLLLQQLIELQQLLIAELLAAGFSELLLQQLTALGRTPLQLPQQLITAAQQIRPAQGHRR